jgi:hypothetical protein
MCNREKLKSNLKFQSKFDVRFMNSAGDLLKIEGGFLWQLKLQFNLINSCLILSPPIHPNGVIARISYCSQAICYELKPRLFAGK